jgi:hypothetical protein
MVMFEESKPDPGPFFYQPDPEKLFFVAAKPERLVRRGPCEYFLVGTMPDGQRVEAQLGSGSLQITP